jgi:hypothetical protein
MDFDPAELDSLSREDLILRARARGVERAEQMTRVELRDEIVRRSEPDLERQRRTRGWLGVARDLLASVVESGLNLPDAAAAIRGEGLGPNEFQGPPPVATVTLAEIYATQGHYEQALRMLDEVIEREPEHGSARMLRDRIAEERDLGPGRRRKVVETKAETIVTPQPPAVAPAPAVVAEPAPVVAAAAAPPIVAPAPAVVEPAPAPAVVEPAPEPEPARAVEMPAEPALEPVTTAALLVLQTADRAFVYWRLPSLSPALRLRSVTVSPSKQGPAIEEADYPLPFAVGGFWLSRTALGSEVRAALGEISSDGFSPLTVARVLDETELAAFDAPGIAADSELETAARAAAGL